MTEYDSTQDTLDHIQLVQKYMKKFVHELSERAKVHDDSKLQSPEKEVFDIVTPKLKAMTYGSYEYRACLDEMGEALKHHYQFNDHHPEHGNGISSMDLMQIVEMFCDWCAATERHDDGDIINSININAARYDFPDGLKSIFTNTARNYRVGKGIEKYTNS